MGEIKFSSFKPMRGREKEKKNEVIGVKKSRAREKRRMISQVEMTGKALCVRVCVCACVRVCVCVCAYVYLQNVV